jgi:hypothetical protein
VAPTAAAKSAKSSKAIVGGASPDLVLAIDPFANPGESPPAPPALASAAAGGCPNQAEIDASFVDLPEALAAITGLELLKAVCKPVPKQKFDYVDTEEAKAERQEAKTKEFMEQGLPEAPARLRAQLFERELVSKKQRAVHNRKRTVVRMVQESRLEKDAAARDERLMLLKMKQDEVSRQMDDAEKDRKQAEEEKEADRKTRDAKVADERKRVEDEKIMMDKIRMEEVARLQAENEARRVQEKKDKVDETKAREDRDNKDKEVKRKMLEEFQAAMQAQMEDQKRLQREERLEEEQEAKESRDRMQAALGLKKPVLDALA